MHDFSQLKNFGISEIEVNCAEKVIRSMRYFNLGVAPAIEGQRAFKH